MIYCRGCIGLFALLGACGGPTAPPADASTRDVAPEAAMDVSTDVAIDTGPIVIPECPQFADGEILGTVTDPGLLEISGIAESRTQPGVFLVHNDSGGGTEVFALNASGAVLSTITVGGASAVDWEDIAVGPGPAEGQEFVYVGDMGDNFTARAFITIYRFLLPTIDPSQARMDTRVEAESFTEFSYPDGATDAETLMVDPLNGELIIVGKRMPGEVGPSNVFRGAFSPGERIVLEQIGSLPFDGETLTGRLTTAGDFSPDGTEFVVRTYTSAYLWRRPVGLSTVDALAESPCEVNLAGVASGQAEAITFAADGTGLIRIDEGNPVPLVLHRRR